MEQKIIELFKKSIVKHEKENRKTRASNIVGHLAKREEMRLWFYQRYPNPSDWTNFFHEHHNHFIYDESNGNFRVRNFSQTLTQSHRQDRQESDVSDNANQNKLD